MLGRVVSVDLPIRSAAIRPPLIIQSIEFYARLRFANRKQHVTHSVDLPVARRAQPASDLLGLPRYTTRKLSSGHATLEKFLNDQLVKTVAKSLPKIGELTERDWVIGQYFSQECYFL